MYTIDDIVPPVIVSTLVVLIALLGYNYIGVDYEVASEPYKVSYEKCTDTVEIPMGDSAVKICVRHVTVYEIRQDYLYKGRLWSSIAPRALYRVDKNYQLPKFDRSVESS